MSDRSNRLVIGVGNEFRNDDAVGLVVAHKLAQLKLGCCDIVESSGEGAGLMHLWEGYDEVILIDAVKSGQRAGTTHVVDVSDQSLPVDQMHFSSHSFGVAEAIEMARILGSLPSRMTIYGVEAGSIEAGNQLSPEVVAASDKLVEMIIEPYTCCEGSQEVK